MKSSLYLLRLLLEEVRGSNLHLSRIVDVERRSSEVSCFVDIDDLGICRSITLMLNVEYSRWMLLLVGAS